MYEFNEYLLENLDTVTGIKRASIGMRSGKSKDFMRHVVLESHDIKMCDLLDICDAMRIPVGHFFYVQGTEPVRTLTGKFDYKPAKMNSGLYNELMKGCSGRYSVPVYKIMCAMGIEDGHARIWTKDVSRITARMLVKLCNAMRMNMTRIIACPMRSVPSLFTMKKFEDRCAELLEQDIQYDAKYPERIAAAKEAQRKARDVYKNKIDIIKKMDEMESAMEEMRRAMAEQQREIEALRKENCMLKEIGSIGIAASPNTPYDRK